MKRSYSKEFATLPHTFEFQSLDQVNRLAEIQSKLPANEVSGKVFILIDEDAHRFALTFLWLIDNGAIPVPASHQLNEEMRKTLQKSFPHASLIINGNVDAIPAEKSENFEGYICLTSGTTGLAKSCHLSTNGALLNATAHADAFGIGKDHQIIQSLPIYHSYGVVAYIWTPLITGCGVDFMKSFVGLRSLKSRPDLSKKVIHISPSQMRFILKDSESPKCAPGILTIGAGAISKAEVQKLLTTFPTSQIHTSYGATELGPRVTSGKLNEAIVHDGFIGKAMKGVSLKVHTESGPLDTGTGLLMVKTPSLKVNTHEDELLDGYYVTRDLVELRASGEVYFLSRGNDIIKKGGVSIYPGDIEEMIRAIPEVVDCIVLKSSHPLYEEVPILYLESVHPEETLTTKVQEKLPSQLWPDQIHVKEVFPRTALGKIDRQKLLEGQVKK